jgi:hypothetical protein
MTTTGALAVDGVVAGQQANPVAAVAVDEIGVLLVAERLDRRGVEALAPGGECHVHGELADQGLARPGRRGHQDAVPVLDRTARLDLEVVECELVETGELGENRVGLPGP